MASSIRSLRAAVALLSGFALLQALWLLFAWGPDSVLTELLVDVVPEQSVGQGPVAFLGANFKYLGFGTAYAAFGALIAWRASADRGRLMIGLVCGAIGADHVCAIDGALFGASVMVRGTARLAFWIIAAGGMLRSAQLFPKRLSAAQLRPAGGGKSVIQRWTLPALGRLLAPGWTWGLAALPYPVIFFTPVPWGAWFAADTAVVGLSIFYLRRQYETETPEGRRRLTWVLSAAVFALASMALSTGAHVLSGAIGTPADLPVLTITSLCTLAILGSLGMGIFYSGVIDPSLVVRRTAVVSALATILMAGVGFLESALAEYLEQLAAGGDILINALIGTVVALGFRPLWDGLEDLADRFLPAETSEHASETEILPERKQAKSEALQCD